MFALTSAGIIDERNPASRVLFDKISSFHPVRCFSKFEENGFIWQLKLLKHGDSFPWVGALT
jgi:hypothetical protein